MKKKILITGGAGFIGSNLALRLIKENYEVTVLDNLSPQIHGANPELTSPLYNAIKPFVNFIKGDITDPDKLTEAIKDQEIIVHFAAETGTGQSMYQIKRYTDVNIGGTALLLDLLANTRHKVKKIVVASSRSIYGEGKYQSSDGRVLYPAHRCAEDMSKGEFEIKYNGENLKPLATDEHAKIHPSSVYGITKQNQEQMIMTVCPSIGIVPVAFRYQNVYGPGQSLSNPYTGILSIFSNLIKHNRTINIFEDGKESRDFVFISDVVEATFKGIDMDAANNQVFNVGTGVATDVITVAETLVRAYKSDTPVVVSGNYRIGDIRHNFADLTKVSSMLNFVPQVDFDNGIAAFVDWVNSQSINVNEYEKSIDELKSRGLYK